MCCSSTRSKRLHEEFQTWCPAGPLLFGWTNDPSRVAYVVFARVLRCHVRLVSLGAHYDLTGYQGQ